MEFSYSIQVLNYLENWLYCINNLAFVKTNFLPISGTVANLASKSHDSSIVKIATLNPNWLDDTIKLR